MDRTLNENDRAAAALLIDFVKVHRRLNSEKKKDIKGKLPKRRHKPVYYWRADDTRNSNAKKVANACFDRL